MVALYSFPKFRARIFFIGILLVFVRTSSVAQTPKPEEEYSTNKAEINFVAVKHDFGNVFRGQHVIHEFPFKNTGKSKLEIRSIHASCGCVNTRVEPTSSFNPGADGKIVFEFDTSWFSGQIVRTITVDSNAPNQATTMLTAVANIKEEIAAKPAIINLGEINGKPKDQTFQIEINEKASGPDTPVASGILAKMPPELENLKNELNTSSAETKVLAAISSSEFMLAEILQKNKNSISISLNFKNTIPSGAFRERVTIWNTSTHLKELVVPVIGEVAEHVKTSTRYIEFGSISVDKSQKRHLTLESNGSDFKVDKISIEYRKTDISKKLEELQVIKYNIQNSKSGYDIKFEMNVPTSLESAANLVNISGFFVFNISDPESHTLKVPFFGILQKENKNE